MKLFPLICVLLLVSGGLLALEISVAPKTLVLSSHGGSFTIHTDVPFLGADEVALTINGTPIDIKQIRTFADDCGNLVVQCRKEAAKAVIGDFQGKRTRATVTLVVDGESDSAELCVKR